MIGAVLTDNIVTNVIVMDESQIEEMSNAHGAKIVDARPYGLSIGDVRQGDGSENNPYVWVRNAGGDNLILQPLTPQEYDSCTQAMNWALVAQAHAETAQEQADAAQARAEAAETELARAQDELTQARSELTQAKSELVQAKSELTQARSELVQAKSELTQAQSELSRARAQLSVAGVALADSASGAAAASTAELIGSGGIATTKSGTARKR